MEKRNSTIHAPPLGLHQWNILNHKYAWVARFYEWLLASSYKPWWRHHMETFSALLALCAGNSPVAGEFPSQRPVTWNFDVFYLCPTKRLSKQSWGWWFRRHRVHCDVIVMNVVPWRCHGMETLSQFQSSERISHTCNLVIIGQRCGGMMLIIVVSLNKQFNTRPSCRGFDARRSCGVTVMAWMHMGLIFHGLLRVIK